MGVCRHQWIGIGAYGGLWVYVDANGGLRVCMWMAINRYYCIWRPIGVCGYKLPTTGY